MELGLGLIIGLALVYAAANLLVGAHERLNRAKCAANLRAIGMACIMYANGQPGSEFPDSFQTLLKYENLTPEIFVCPSDQHTTASSGLSADSLSYVYLGNGLTETTASTKIIAYDRLGSHGKDGINVLYGDATVQWVKMADALRLIHRRWTPATKPE
ncbi:MAG TPA: hypothetical protein VFC78_23115 [Tepidisphaeraceae bacterium]|nr:hypothetical protein [Tepidisphaeraceae bacterium]